MSDISSITSQFAALRNVANPAGGIGSGLKSFSAVLAAARPVGPDLRLPSDLPRSGQVLTAPLVSATRGADTAVGPQIRLSTGPLPQRATAWTGAIEVAANKYGIDANLLAAVVWTESAFRPDARSPAGAIGLGQLMPGTAADLGVDPYDPIQNLDGAANYLRQQIDRFGSDELALAAYNAGPGRVIQSGGIPNISETQAYVRIVTARRAELVGAAT